MGAAAISGPIAAATGVGAPVALGLLIPMEAGVPIPIPSDLVALAVGERVSAGAFPLWLAVVGLEVVATVGTSVLFFVSRGAGRALVARIGPRVGLDQSRIERGGFFLERRGRPSLVAGRAIPGLRTLTVVAAGAAGLSTRRALPALILGSSMFLQLHLVIGLLFGPLARRAYDAAKGPTLAVGITLVLVAIVFWRKKRGGHGVAGSWSEAACPACLGLSLLGERPMRSDSNSSHALALKTEQSA